MELADLLVGLAVTIIGLYLTHSLRRQQRLKVAEQRMASYGELWKLMEIARPTRLEAWEAAGPLTRKEARGLYADMTHWYFGTAHGMLLTETTKKLYLRTKASLGQYVVGTDPDWQHAGRRAIRELSLLRQQMKLDLDIYGVSYFDEGEDVEGDEEVEKRKKQEEEDDEAFLRSAGINPRRWARPPLRRRLVAIARGMVANDAPQPSVARGGTTSTGTDVDSPRAGSRE
jgi:hypothetical protein